MKSEEERMAMGMKAGEFAHHLIDVTSSHIKTTGDDIEVAAVALLVASVAVSRLAGDMSKDDWIRLCEFYWNDLDASMKERAN